MKFIRTISFLWLSALYLFVTCGIRLESMAMAGGTHSPEMFTQQAGPRSDLPSPIVVPARYVPLVKPIVFVLEIADWGPIPADRQLPSVTASFPDIHPELFRYQRSSSNRDPPIS